MNEVDVAGYLQRRIDQVEVTSVRKIGGGASRETWLVQLARTNGGLPEELILRRDTPTAGVVPTSLHREYEVLRQLSDAGLPVPRPLWFEDEPEDLGQRFYIREGYQGTSDQRRFSGATAERLAKELAEALARIHRTPVDAIELPEGPPAADAAEATLLEVERWYAHWQESALEPAPMYEQLTWWLRRHVAGRGEPTVFVWGDVGVANTICGEDGSVLALSDWELAAYGDPMRDLASGLWRGVGRLAGRSTFLRAYEDAGGFPIDETRLAYHEVFMSWLVAGFTHSATRGSTAGDGRSLHPALLSIWAQRMNLRKAATGAGFFTSHEG